MGVIRQIRIEAFLPTGKATAAERIADRIAGDLSLVHQQTEPHPEGGHIARFTCSLAGESWAEDVLTALTLATQFGRDIRLNGAVSEALTIAVLAPSIIGVDSVTLEFTREGEPE